MQERGCGERSAPSIDPLRRTKQSKIGHRLEEKKRFERTVLRFAQESHTPLRRRSEKETKEKIELFQRDVPRKCVAGASGNGLGVLPHILPRSPTLLRKSALRTADGAAVAADPRRRPISRQAASRRTHLAASKKQVQGALSKEHVDMHCLGLRVVSQRASAD